ncbi:MAG: hypothetical protein QOG11_1655 [Solirubrobacteraceae bacterium]|nr:hypothetical protein [Solirubrobacteraceae bacterium]
MPCLVVAAATMASGCGTSADRDQARAAAERFYAAVRQHDGRTACEQLSSSLRAQLVKGEPGDDCATAVLQLSLHGSRAAAVRVYATAAEVVLAGGDTVFLGDTRQGWRLDAVGCKPQGSGPFDCEEQA